jgi:hypothetical protein
MTSDSERRHHRRLKRKRRSQRPFRGTCHAGHLSPGGAVIFLTAWAHSVGLVAENSLKASLPETAKMHCVIQSSLRESQLFCAPGGRGSGRCVNGSPPEAEPRCTRNVIKSLLLAVCEFPQGPKRHQGLLDGIPGLAGLPPRPTPLLTTRLKVASCFWIASRPVVPTSCTPSICPARFCTGYDTGPGPCHGGRAPLDHRRSLSTVGR